MARIFLVRHGETLWNRNFLYQGQKDIPLNEKGRQQAERLAKVLKRETFDAVYSSDLERALETAEIIAAPRGLRVISTKDLRELSFGEWEGHSYQELEEKYPDEFHRWRCDPGENRPPGGESLKDLMERVSSFVKLAAKNHPEGNILIVTHAGPIRAILTAVLDLDFRYFWKFKVSNGSITVFEYDGSGELNNDNTFIVKVNETLHLE
ncbi:alpha-ribazole phosphatase [Thermosediminibacter litoriperuensis]|uniref:Alpha-ribazole phosphatase n=1 Tax=Thermosediminibacter litoriperuensis TaxID=291989 RepID=A0A5S5AVP3_9FIRM|nr:alpha-ribazole phosphatase [Thermosediminibacter litoriperuensis]TYP56798.1 alpha-ribazole phosphatase/probable phosphoglycerate mutase [Thermosediminibacter litoriperuensis]